MPSSDSRYRFVIKKPEYPYSQISVWEIRDTKTKRTVFTSEQYPNEELCKKELGMLIGAHVIVQIFREQEIWLP